jgi:hypothetical protein
LNDVRNSWRHVMRSIHCPFTLAEASKLLMHLYQVELQPRPVQ